MYVTFHNGTGRHAKMREPLILNHGNLFQYNTILTYEKAWKLF